MTVGENVGYGLKVKGLKGTAARAKVAEALGRVDLGGLEDRPVGALSGGQQQRVALARALAVEPAVLLFDEPLSNLDLALREATRAELKRLQRELGTTSLYVTHDQQEALALADEVAVLRAGELVEMGTPDRLYDHPETAFVARFLGGANVLSGALAEKLAGTRAPEGAVLAVRPERLEPVAEAGEQSIPVHLGTRQFLGTHVEWSIEVDTSDSRNSAENAEANPALRLWTAPGTTLPQPLYVRAQRHRWVRADTDDGTPLT